MGVTNSNKVINADRIECDGSLKVTLALTAAPDIVSNPTDIVLVLDRSGSMAGAPLAAVKAGSKSFIDIIAEATGGAPGQIGAGSQIGVVSFSDTATTDSPRPTRWISSRTPWISWYRAAVPTMPPPSSGPWICSTRSPTKPG